ncbi:MAG: hypothetical protein ACI815_002438 [Psychroserpens sp.]|jgi:hypothetical protein
MGLIVSILFEKGIILTVNRDGFSLNGMKIIDLPLKY